MTDYIESEYRRFMKKFGANEVLSIIDCIAGEKSDDYYFRMFINDNSNEFHSQISVGISQAMIDLPNIILSLEFMRLNQLRITEILQSKEVDTYKRFLDEIRNMQHYLKDLSRELSNHEEEVRYKMQIFEKDFYLFQEEIKNRVK